MAEVQQASCPQTRPPGPLAAVRESAFFRRVRSLPADVVDQGTVRLSDALPSEDAIRGRKASPIQANTKRRRSVPDTASFLGTIEATRIRTSRVEFETVGLGNISIREPSPPGRSGERIFQADTPYVPTSEATCESAVLFRSRTEDEEHLPHQHTPPRPPTEGHAQVQLLQATAIKEPRPNSGVCRTPSRRSQSRGRTRTRISPYPIDVPVSSGYRHRSTLVTETSQSSCSEESASSVRDLPEALTPSPESLALSPVSSGESFIVNQNPPERSRLRYELKGAYLLQKKAAVLPKFRFPEASSQPEPAGRPDDGFSGDEARPDFLFLMTGRRKRPRSRSLSALGELQLRNGADEKEDTTTDAAASPPAASSHVKTEILSSQKYVRLSPRRVSEAWPTAENFGEDPIPRALRRATKRAEERQKTTARHHHRRPAAATTQRRPPEESVPVPVKFAMQPRVPRARMQSDFENFGRRPSRRVGPVELEPGEEETRGMSSLLLERIRLLRDAPPHSTGTGTGSEHEESRAYIIGSEEDEEEEDFVPQTDYHDTDSDDDEHLHGAAGSPRSGLRLQRHGVHRE